jgi:hypothetical protein
VKHGGSFEGANTAFDDPNALRAALERIVTRVLSEPPPCRLRGGLADRVPIRFLQDPHHLLFAEPTLLHGFLSFPRNPLSQVSNRPRFAAQVSPWRDTTRSGETPS